MLSLCWPQFLVLLPLWGAVRHWGLSNETTYGVCRFCEVAAKLAVPPPVSIQNGAVSSGVGGGFGAGRGVHTPPGVLGAGTSTNQCAATLAHGHTCQ